MKTYQVGVWKNGADYDACKPADAIYTLKAPDVATAEDKADRKAKRELGTCEVIGDAVLLSSRK